MRATRVSSKKRIPPCYEHIEISETDDIFTVMITDKSITDKTFLETITTSIHAICIKIL